MSNSDFIEEYIENCIAKGISAENKICESAIVEMQEIDKKLRESNELRVRLSNLKQILRYFGHESTKKPRVNDIKILGDIGSIQDSSFISTMISICEFIENSNKNSVTSREIQNTLGSIDNDSKIMICIKNLYDNGILDKNSDRHVLKGKNWENRPQNSELNNKIA